MNPALLSYEIFRTRESVRDLTLLCELEQVKYRNLIKYATEYIYYQDKDDDGQSYIGSFESYAKSGRLSVFVQSFRLEIFS
jgi:hypothetical protein